MAVGICVVMPTFLANVMSGTATYAIDENMQEMWCNHW